MEPLTAVLAAAAAVGAWLICAYLAFSRTTLRTVVRLDDSGGLRHSIWTWKYPQWRGWAKTGLVVIPIALALGLLVLLTGGSDGGGGDEVEATAAADARSPSLAPTEASPATAAPSPTVSPVPTTAEPAATVSTQGAFTQTPSPTATATAQDTATLPPAPSVTPAWTPSQEPAAPTPTFTPTLEPVVETPTWTPTEPPTPIPTPVRPEPLEPLLGREYKNPVTFTWRGALTTGQTYQVTAYHAVSGDSLQSDLLDSPEWTADLPAQRFGEWRWQVSVVRFGVVTVTSPEWMFWFNPFPVTRFPTPTPTPTPTRTPKPTSP